MIHPLRALRGRRFRYSMNNVDSNSKLLRADVQGVPGQDLTVRRCAGGGIGVRGGPLPPTAYRARARTRSAIGRPRHSG